MSLPRSYFDDIYQHAEDPWGFRTRWYETRKRSLVMASLTSQRYATAFEPGCSIGVLTESLCGRVDRLVAMDISDRALDVARPGLPDHVDLRRGQVPKDWPDERFDLVVISELAYYLSAEECQVLAQRAAAAAGELVVVHWRHPVADYPLGGDVVREIFTKVADSQGLEPMVVHLEPDFCIDSWCRDRRSPAARTGLLSR